MTGDDAEAPIAASWSNNSAVLAALILPVLIVVGVSIAVRVHSVGEIVFLALWFGILGWNAYWFLFRVVRRLELRGETLYWYAILRRGSVRVEDIVGLSRMRGAPGVLFLRTRAGVSPAILVRGGFGTFLRHLHRMNPAVPDRLPFAARLMSGPPWR
ncbi:hypothetical protein AB4Z18_08615 [Leifsonia sp. 2TAF2]|uniref:hypothetical protein n=1 Tax=Leifsonia sp. 2TAF2 TaxID=3233009 RepID=UPI003F982B40